MDIKLLDSTGVAESEKAAFNRLEEALPDSWQGYGSYSMYQFTDKYEIDLIIIAHDRIILVELKNWRGEVHLKNNDWIQYINGVETNNHHDVVALAAKKAKILASKSASSIVASAEKEAKLLLKDSKNFRLLILQWFSPIHYLMSFLYFS